MLDRNDPIESRIAALSSLDTARSLLEKGRVKDARWMISYASGLWRDALGRGIRSGRVRADALTHRACLDLRSGSGRRDLMRLTGHYSRKDSDMRGARRYIARVLRETVQV